MFARPTRSQMQRSITPLCCLGIINIDVCCFCLFVCFLRNGSPNQIHHLILHICVISCTFDIIHVRGQSNMKNFSNGLYSQIFIETDLVFFWLLIQFNTEVSDCHFLAGTQPLPPRLQTPNKAHLMALNIYQKWRCYRGDMDGRFLKRHKYAWALLKLNNYHKHSSSEITNYGKEVADYCTDYCSLLQCECLCHCPVLTLFQGSQWVGPGWRHAGPLFRKTFSVVLLHVLFVFIWQIPWILKCDCVSG